MASIMFNFENFFSLPNPEYIENRILTVPKLCGREPSNYFILYHCECTQVTLEDVYTPGYDNILQLIQKELPARETN